MDSLLRSTFLAIVLFLVLSIIALAPHRAILTGCRSASTYFQLVYIRGNTSQSFQPTEGTTSGNEEVVFNYSYFRAPTELSCPEEYPFDQPKEHFSTELIQAALESRAGIRGFHQKAGILNTEQWLGSYEDQRKSQTLNWFRLPNQSRRQCKVVQPPYQYPGCLVHINHHYKFIWIKGKKVGGTSIREPLGWICGDNWKAPTTKNASYCSERWHLTKELHSEDARKYWSDYFVFAFVRNPYSRFASSFTYIKPMVSPCHKRVSFGIACMYPFVQPYMCKRFSCCSEGEIRHHIHHIMEQNSCLFTYKGEIAVDFVGETETLNEDLQIIIDVINQRRDKALPPLEIPGEQLKKVNSRKAGENYVEELYRTDSHCLKFVEHYFWKDFARLGYNRTTKVFKNF